MARRRSSKEMLRGFPRGIAEMQDAATVVDGQDIERRAISCR